ncbi:MAG: hypothetical protein MHM6MM_005457 [Cercozoa sp. M6MM]
MKLSVLALGLASSVSAYSFGTGLCDADQASLQSVSGAMNWVQVGTGTGDYTIDAPATYAPGDKVVVGLLSPLDPRQIRGFVIQTVDASGTPIGTWDQTGDLHFGPPACASARTSLTHADTTLEDFLVLTWNAPAAQTGTVTMQAIVYPGCQNVPNPECVVYRTTAQLTAGTGSTGTTTTTTAANAQHTCSTTTPHAFCADWSFLSSSGSSSAATLTLGDGTSEADLVCSRLAPGQCMGPSGPAADGMCNSGSGCPAVATKCDASECGGTPTPSPGGGDGTTTTTQAPATRQGVCQAVEQNSNVCGDWRDFSDLVTLAQGVTLDDLVCASLWDFRCVDGTTGKLSSATHR